MTDFAGNTLLARLREAYGRVPMRLRELALRAGAAPHHLQSDEHHPPRHCRDLLRGKPRLRKAAVGLGVLGTLGLVACGGLWWLLNAGSLPMGLATPWLVSALQDRLGGSHRVEVGGTVLERDEEGRLALRLRDVVVRGADGSVVASAPRAEVALTGLLSGRPRAERLSLIGAQMAVRIETDGQFSVFAGATEPHVTGTSAGEAATTRGAEPGAGAGSLPAPPSLPVAGTPLATIPNPAAPAGEQPSLLATIVGWLHTLDAVGLDGQDLIEIGLKNGSLAVDDRRTGKQLGFGNINLALSRLKDGGALLAVSSMGTDGPWSLNATVTPRTDGVRALEAVVRDLSPKDVLLALRLDNANFEADLPLSAVIRAELKPDGTVQAVGGRVLAGAGYLGDPKDTEARFLVDEAQMELRWDDVNNVLVAPIEVQSGANRVSVVAQLQPPAQRGGAWSFAVLQGMAVLASLERPGEPPLVLDRIAIRGAFDSARKRLDLHQGDFRGGSAGVAMSGNIEYGGVDPRVNLGIAGTPMAVSALKKLWPVFVNPELRSWVIAHVVSGHIDRMSLAVNMRLRTLMPSTPPPQADEDIRLELVSKNAVVRPIDGIPAVRDAELSARVAGRIATVSFGRGVVDLPSGRKLAVNAGSFEVPDLYTTPKWAGTRLKVDGPIEAVAELLAMQPFKEAASLPFDPGAAKGSVSAQIAAGMPLGKSFSREAVTYAIEADLAGFAAERFVRGYKAEAASMRVSATQNLLQIKGDMKIAGTPTAVEYRKARNDTEAELRVQSTLDDAARGRLGFDVGSALSGPVPVKLAGRIRSFDKDGARLTVEADLTQAKVLDLLPGWVKPAGRAARSSFTVVDRGQTTRLEDFMIEGSGASVRGAIELDPQGDIVQAAFPTFTLSDGDKATLKAERASDGTLKVTLRGDVYDGRGLFKTAVAGQKPDQKAKRPQDMDIDLKLGTITGHHGEALRAVELRMSRRAGQVRSFALTGKLGSEGYVTGDLRGRGGNARHVIYVESNDAGALFRLTDTYARIVGGWMSVAMDPPTADNAPQDGLLNIRDFSVRGETTLDKVATSRIADAGERGAALDYGNSYDGVSFSRMRVEFTKSPGKFAIRDGVIWGPMIGATMDGTLDYFRDEVRLRGTLVPAYGINNMFSRLPVIGMLLGGGANEGLLGITYQVVGSPAAPTLQVNPMSVVAPGFLRKIFEFRGGEERPPERTGQAPLSPSPR